MKKQTVSDWATNGYPPEQRHLLPDDDPLELWVSGGCVWANNPSDQINGAVNVSLSNRLAIEAPSRFVMDDRWMLVPCIWQGTRVACGEQLARILELMRL